MSETSGADTVDPAATDRRGLKVLGFDECLQRLRDAVVGRVGFLRDGEIAVLPVNHVVDGMDIAFRTSWGSKLQIAADAGLVEPALALQAADAYREYRRLQHQVRLTGAPHARVNPTPEAGRRAAVEALWNAVLLKLNASVNKG